MLLFQTNSPQLVEISITLLLRIIKKVESCANDGFTEMVTNMLTVHLHSIFLEYAPIISQNRLATYKKRISQLSKVQLQYEKALFIFGRDK